MQSLTISRVSAKRRSKLVCINVKKFGFELINIPTKSLTAEVNQLLAVLPYLDYKIECTPIYLSSTNLAVDVCQWPE